MTDISDDGDDTDGNVIDDPTIVQTEPRAMVEVTKVATVTIPITIIRMMLQILLSIQLRLPTQVVLPYRALL